MATYDLDLNRIMRSIRQKKATGGYVPQTFINDILEANINQAAGSARSEKALSLQEQAQKTSAENAAKSLALQEANAATQKAQYATSLEESKRNADLNRGLTEEQINSQGKSNIASLVTQAPMAIWAGKQLYDKIFTNPPPPTPPPTPGSITGPSPLTQPDPFTVDQSLAPEATPSWLQTEPVKPDPFVVDQSLAPEVFDAGTPSAEFGEVAPNVVSEAIPASSLVPGTPAAEALSASYAGEMGAAGGGATLGSIGSGALSAGPWIAAKELGMPILKNIMEKGTESLTGAEPDSSNVLARMNRIAGDDRGLVTPALEELGVDVPSWMTGVMNPVGTLLSGLTGKGTWICTAIKRHVGTTHEERLAMRKLRRYAKQNHAGWLEAYNQKGLILIEAIKAREADLLTFYADLKPIFLWKCVDLVDGGDLESAFNHYKDETVKLFKEYAPEVPIAEAG